MFPSKRGFRVSRRRPVATRFAAERLETRALLATNPSIDLTNIAFGAPGGNPPAYGVQEAGGVPAGGVGWAVKDVGDVNGDGFDDFVVGAPTITGSGAGVTINNGANSRAYLIFGSSQVTVQTIPTIANWLASQPIQRVGDLLQLGNNTQTNPTNSTTTGAYQFNGITFFTSQNPNSQLGASVTALGDINGDGFADFMIGAPGSSNGNGLNPGTGRAYIIYGGPALSNSLQKSIDLDTPSSYLTPTITLFSNNLTAGANLGFSGAAGDVIADNFIDVAVGAPNADPLGANGVPVSNAGEVFLISGAALHIEPGVLSTTINVDNVGQTVNNVPGITITGAAPGDQAGWSLAAVGDISKSTIFTDQSDLAIGALQSGTGNGEVFFINAQIHLDTLFEQVISGVNQINLAQVSNPSITPIPTTLPTNVPGAIFSAGTTGNTGLQIGYSLAAAGNLGSGLFSFMIGAPDSGGANPAVYLLTGPPSGFIDLTQLTGGTIGTQPLQNGTPGVPSYSVFQGDANSLAGFSETAVGDRNGSSSVNDIAIGAPGENGGEGEVYWISHNNALNNNVVYQLIGVGQSSTTTTTGLVGATFVAPPPPNDEENPNATNPLLASYTTTPAFLGASVSGIIRFVGKTGFTVDQDTIGDLIIGAPGYSLANYPVPTTGPLLTSRPAAGAVFAIEGAFIPFTGSNSGGGGGGGGGGGVATAIGASTTLPPPLPPVPLGSSLIPPLAALSQYDSYVPLAQSIAYAQFRPSAGWLLRMEVFSGRISQKNPNIQRHGFTLPGHNNSGIHTLNNRVFTRSKYHATKVIKFAHKVPVVPRNRQHNVFAG